MKNKIIPPPRKVLFITHCSFMGGANHSMIQLIKELKRDYHLQCTVIVPIHNVKELKQGIFTILEEENIPYIISKFYWFKFPYKNLIERIKSIIYVILNWLLFYPLLFLKLRKTSFDIIHTNSSVIDTGLFISMITNKSNIWHLREFGDKDFKLFCPLGKWYEKIIYNKKNNTFIAISNAVKKRFEFDININKINLIYNGISAEKYTQATAHNNKIINFCCCGVVSPAKNQLEIIKAARILIYKYKKTDFLIHFAGFDEDILYKQSILSYINNNNLSKNIIFHGNIKEMSAFLKKMDVGLMVSNCEAFGRVTVEYMLHKLCVIANNKGANEEIVSHQNNGLIYQHNNYEDLANNMYFILNNPNVMKLLGENGYTTAINKFNSHQNTNLIYNLYKKHV